MIQTMGVTLSLNNHKTKNFALSSVFEFVSKKSRHPREQWSASNQAISDKNEDAGARPCQETG
jgi:hypothetical protein